MTSYAECMSEVLVNWMKTTSTCPAMYVIAQDSQQVQRIVMDENVFPSPIRPSGALLSPSNIHLNEKGTVISMIELNQIHGMVDVALGTGQIVSCIDTDPGVTLRELQLYAQENNMELPYSAEIGSATIGGTIMTTTKDSAIGTSPIAGMGIGDVSSCLFGVTLVEEGGVLMEYRVVDEDGNFGEDFQSLLDSQGTRGIAVRMLLTVRPTTPLTTTYAIEAIDDISRMATRLYQLQTDAAKLEGNIFVTLDTQSQTATIEERIPTANSNLFVLPFYQRLMGLLLTKLKEQAIIQGRVTVPLPRFVSFFAKGSFLTRFNLASRPAGNAYTSDVPLATPKLAFTYIAFPMEEFTEITSACWTFIQNYERMHGFAPAGVAIYFVTHSGKRLAGPYGSDSSVSFSFDPIFNDPNTIEWSSFLDAFHEYAEALGGLPGLNQSPGVEKLVTWGSTAVHGSPNSRFTTPWLQQFFDAKALN